MKTKKIISFFMRSKSRKCSIRQSLIEYLFIPRVIALLFFVLFCNVKNSIVPLDYWQIEKKYDKYAKEQIRQRLIENDEKDLKKLDKNKRCFIEVSFERISSFEKLSGFQYENNNTILKLFYGDIVDNKRRIVVELLLPSTQIKDIYLCDFK